MDTVSFAYRKEKGQGSVDSLCHNVHLAMAKVESSATTADKGEQDGTTRPACSVLDNLRTDYIFIIF